MPLYYVGMREVWIRTVKVRADTKKQACEAARCIEPVGDVVLEFADALEGDECIIEEIDK